MPPLANTFTCLVAALALASSAAATTVTITSSHMPSLSIGPFEEFSAALENALENASAPPERSTFSYFSNSNNPTQEPLPQLLEIVQSTAAEIATSNELRAPEEHVNETAAEDGANNFAGLAEAGVLRAGSTLLEHLQTAARVTPSSYRTNTNVHADPTVRDLYEGFSNHVDANNGELYTAIVEMEFENREQAVRKTLTDQVLKVADSAPTELAFFPQWYVEVWNEPNCCGGYPYTDCCGSDDLNDDTTMAGLESTLLEHKKDIERFENCDDDTKDNSGNDCFSDGDHTGARNEKVLDLKGELESGLHSVQEAEVENDRQRERVLAAKKDVVASEESPEATLEALLEDMIQFRDNLDHHGTAVANMKSNLNAVALRLIVGMQSQISALNANATEARDEAQKWLDGEMHASLAEMLRRCMAELAKQAQYVAKREVATHEVAGFDAARKQTIVGADRLLVQQKIAIDFVKSTIAALTKLQKYVTKTRSSLESTCDDYYNTIDDRHTVILTQKEKLVADLYSWHDVYEYLPAVQDAEMAKTDLTRATKAKKVVCGGYGSATNTRRCDNAKADFNEAKLMKATDDARIVTQKKIRDQVLVAYGNYTELRSELTRRGVHLPDDVAEGQQGLGLIQTMSEMYDSFFAPGGGLEGKGSK